MTQLLCGSRNLTLRTLSDIYVALGYRIVPATMPITVAYADYLRHRPSGGIAAPSPTRKRLTKALEAAG